MRFVYPALLAVAALAAGVWAAPILKRTPPEVDTILSMADLKVVTVEVRPMPRTLRGRMITATRIDKIFRKELEAIGLEVQEDRADNIPHLVLSVRAATDTRQPGVMALYTLIAVYQDVDLKRLDRSMRALTDITVDVHLTTVKKAPGAVASRVRHSVQIKGRLIAKATSVFRGMP